MARSRSRGRSIGTISRTRPGLAASTSTCSPRNSRLVDRMGDEQDGGAGLLPDAAQLLVQPVARDLVERAERLVHQQQPRAAEQRAGDRDALAHAAGQLVREVPSPSLRGRPASAARAASARPRQAARRRRPRAAARHSAAPCARAAARRPGTRSRATRFCARLLRRVAEAPRPCPLVGAIRSATTRSRVDLPQPEGPSRLRKPPRSTSKEMSSQRGDGAPLGDEAHRRRCGTRPRSHRRTAARGTGAAAMRRSWRFSRSSAGCRRSS